MSCKTLRVLDIILSLLGLFLSILPLSIIAVIIKLTSRGPVLFSQARIGRYGTSFVIYKLRTMHVDSQASKGAIQGSNLSFEALKKLRESYKTTSLGDKRITAVGKWLRRFYIDELPQLFNVLRGDMSLVGPRPDAPVQVVDYSERQWQKRHIISPGITGLAQIFQKRMHFNASTRVSLDLYYVKKRSLKLYLWVLWKTISIAMFKGSF